MRTLHWYILRELLKTFALTVIALSVLFTMGGGLYNVMRYEGITPGDLFAVMPMLLPIVITLMMPISALFAVTILYGRLAADNELSACRAAGINVHRLFLAAVVLAVGVTAVSLFATNLVIPRFMQRIEYFARSNIRNIVFNKIRQSGFVRYTNNRNNNYYVLTARQVQDVEEGALIEKGFRAPGRDVGYFWVDQPTLLWIDGNERLQRFAAAEGALCEFDTGGNKVTFTAYVKNGRDFEVGKSETILAEQKVGPIPVPIRFPVRPAMVDLGTLLRWRARPWTSPELGADIHSFTRMQQIYRLYQRIAVELDRGNALVLTDDHDRRYEFSALQIAAQERVLRVTDARLVRYDPDQRIPTRFEAPLGTLVIRGDGADALVVAIHLEQDGDIPVLQYNPRTGNAAEPLRVDTTDAAGLDLPAALLAEIPPLAPEAVVDPTHAIDVHETMQSDLAKLRRDSDNLHRKVAALIHARLSFAGSPLVTILMGAALGVIFRGSRMLAGFGLACIPFGLTALLILVGRQLIEGNDASFVGPLVVWGGLGLVLAADLVLLRIGVQR